MANDMNSFQFQLSRLSTAHFLADFIDACTNIVACSSHVRIVEQGLAVFLPLVRAAEPTVWNPYLRSADCSLVEAVFDIVLSSALNGGYFHRSPDSGEVVQWQEDGSGSQALVSWLRDLRAERLLPWENWRCGQLDAMVHVDQRLKGLPYPALRMAVLQELAHDLGPLLEWASVLDAALSSGRAVPFGLAEADMLVAWLPKSFGEDPFRKKACLAVLMIAGHLQGLGHRVTCSVPVPADYQLPRILHWGGALELSCSLQERLRSGAMIDAMDQDIVELRAATIVGCHRIGHMTDLPDWVVDGALFGSVRGQADFRSQSLPPMHINGIWF